jgi:hypothetical protein
MILILSVVIAVFTQSQEPWVGTWRLNVAKSTPDREARFKRTTIRIEPWEDGIRVTYNMVGTRGGVTHLEWIGKFDGKDYPIQGVDYVLTNAYSQTSSQSYNITNKVDGVETSRAEVVISPDGKTLTTVTTGKNSQGKAASTTVVYERQ